MARGGGQEGREARSARGAGRTQGARAPPVQPSTAVHTSDPELLAARSRKKPKKLVINLTNKDSSSNESEQQLLSPEEADAVLALITLAKNSKRTSADNVPTVVTAPNKGTSENTTKFVCDECGKYYATSSNLSRHKQTHRSLNSELAQRCRDCNKMYVSMSALAMHTLTHRMRHSCGVCGKQFSRPWLLRGHLRSHTGEKPYKCIVCGKSFADRSNLRAHVQTHSPEKKFECMRCNKTFALKTYLNKHQESACTRLSNN